MQSLILFEKKSYLLKQMSKNVFTTYVQHQLSYVSKPSVYLFIYLLFSHNKDYTSITLYKDVARGPQKTTRLVRGGPLVTIILSNRTITTHNNGQYKTHYRYSRKSKTFVLNDCNVKN